MSVADFIRRIFIGPIAKSKPSSLSEKDYLDYVFHTSTRIISFYRTLRSTTIPGTFTVNGRPCHYEPQRCRTAPMHTVLVVRKDDVLDLLEVDHAGHVFRLNEQEWQALSKDIVAYQNEEKV